MKKLLFFAPLIIALSLHADPSSKKDSRSSREICALSGIASVVAVDTACLLYAAANSGSSDVLVPLIISIGCKVPEILAMVHQFYPTEHEQDPEAAGSAE